MDGPQDDEAPKDPGVTKPVFTVDEGDIEGHRAHTMFNGAPETRHSHKHHSHRRRRRDSIPNAPEGPCTPPAQRVQFILGEDGGGDERHESHPLFSEMEELVVPDDGDGDMVWRETARWIKFEENVEEGGNRWSKPHVATLSLHALFELRNYLLNGIVVLDMEASTMEQIANRLVEAGVAVGAIRNEQIDKLKEALLKRHRHQFQKKHHVLPMIRSFADIGRNLSTSKIEEQSFVEHSLGQFLTIPTLGTVDKPQTGMKKSASTASIGKTHSSTDLRALNGDVSPTTPHHQHSHNTHFMKKVPLGAEASNILVGEVDFLDRQIAMFVRLNAAAHLSNLTEVPVPTRFIFILLGPATVVAGYHEVGRAMATLMSDEVFHEVAYRARNRQHLLAGVDEFLDAVTVLPPGEWDPTIRIEPPAALPSQEPRLRYAADYTTSSNSSAGGGPDGEDGGPHPKTHPQDSSHHIDEDSGLQRTGKLFGGLVNDVRRKLPFYLSDFKDVFAVQCIASWIFLYFACLSPIITFGGLLSDATGRNMAAMESLVSGFVCGMGYGFFSGQPLTVLGSTGPVLVFETIVYDFCQQMDWDYLSFRLWIGTWITIILVVLVAIDASALVCYITRFTEENFATLIAFIFIYKAVENVLLIGKKFPIHSPHQLESLPNFTNGYDCSCIVNDTIQYKYPDISDWQHLNETTCTSFNGTLIGRDCFSPEAAPNVFLMSVLLFIGTFLVSVELKEFKNALFFSSRVRQFISDFAVIIAILSMTLLDYKTGISTPKLEVPHEFKPTSGRSWLVPPFNGNPFYSVFLAIPPALLGTILIFMDQQITSVIINRKEHKLKKKCGYHLDLFVLSILIQICSMMGLPWFVAATVLSINHVNSLKVESECTAPGEKPQFLGVREQRVTHILIFLTIGMSVFLTPMLGHIPMPVLYGVFLYMGCASLKGLQFFDRILIMFMPVKYQPDYMFLRQVPIKRVHLFTIIQLACLICLWTIKSFSTTSILFPLMLVVMIGIRKCLDFVFTRRELEILDDIMPETTKKDELLKDKEDDVEDLKASKKIDPNEPNANMPLINGKAINVPLSAINITEEVNKTSIWKQLHKGKDAKKIFSSQLKKVKYTAAGKDPEKCTKMVTSLSLMSEEDPIVPEGGITIKITYEPPNIEEEFDKGTSTITNV